MESEYLLNEVKVANQPNGPSSGENEEDLSSNIFFNYYLFYLKIKWFDGFSIIL